LPNIRKRLNKNAYRSLEVVPLDERLRSISVGSTA
jgi:hypothetical protein